LPQALRAIVLAAVHEMARTQEHKGGGNAQSWTNELSATCQDGAWVIVIMVAAIRWCRGHSERASAERELAGTRAIRQDGIVTNAMEAIRQHVNEEARVAFRRSSRSFALTRRFGVLLPLVDSSWSDRQWLYEEHNQHHLRSVDFCGEDHLASVCECCGLL